MLWHFDLYLCISTVQNYSLLWFCPDGEFVIKVRRELGASLVPGDSNFEVNLEPSSLLSSSLHWWFSLHFYLFHPH